MKISQVALRAFLLLFSIVWAKLAIDLVFFFGPESAREWFGLRAISAMVFFSLSVVALNVYIIATPSQDLGPGMSRVARSASVLAILGGIFACLIADTTVKFFQIYIVAPALIVLLVASGDSGFGRGNMAAIVVLAMVLLWPSDTCENPPNWWWLNHVGSSPLTYLFPVNALFVLVFRDRGKVGKYAVPAVVAVYFVGSVYHRFMQGY